MVKINFDKNVSRIYNVAYASENRQLINSEFENNGISEMRSYMNDVISKSKPNYPLGMMKLFKQRPNYMPGGKHYTDRPSSAFSASSDDNGSVNRCNKNHYRDGETTGKIQYDAKVDDVTMYGCDNICVSVYTVNQNFNYRPKSGSYDYNSTITSQPNKSTNIIGGWNLICYEYVGGDYWYDDENKIQYGMPDPSYCLETNKWRI